jgi:lycopene cyclase domain-containing protein
MTPLYLYLLLGSLSIPMLYSVFFIDFVKNWRAFFLSTTIMAAVFLLWDVIFTEKGIWGFEKTYCVGIHILKMPIEEWFFFFIIPFCSLFTHFAFFYKFPSHKLNKQTTLIITFVLILTSLVLLLINYSKAYTLVNYSILLIVLSLGLLCNIQLLQKFYISFLIIVVPFFIINGVLTGAVTEIPVVWYDNVENLGMRLYTIPIEDIGYAFSMLFGNLMLFEKFNKK